MSFRCRRRWSAKAETPTKAQRLIPQIPRLVAWQAILGDAKRGWLYSLLLNTACQATAFLCALV